jgi:hypothetical protein
MKVFSRLAAGVLAIVGSHAAILDVPYDPASASYNVTLDGVLYLVGDIYALRQDGALLTSRPGGGLVLDGPASAVSGFGVFGQFSGWNASFNQGLMQVSTQTYTLPSGASAVVFEQFFARGVQGSQYPSPSEGMFDISAAFPSFAVNDSDATPSKAFLTMSGGMSPSHMAPFTHEGASPSLIGLNSAVAALFSAPSSSLPQGGAVTISALQNFMVSSIYFPPSLAVDGDYPIFAGGVSGRLSSIPVGWRQSFLLVSAPPSAPAGSVNASVHAWGEALLAAGGMKQRTRVSDDFHSAYLSVYSDNGSWYYYTTLPNKTNQDTLIAVKSYVQDQLQLPVRSFQFDSFWYFKQWPRSGPMTEWAAMPDVFQSGYSDNWLGMPTVAHSKFFAVNNTYAAPPYNCGFHAEPEVNASIPVDACAYTAMLAPAVAAWDLRMLEVDWLSYTYQLLNITQEDPYAAANWMSSISQGAQANGVTVQLCMALPSQMLHTTLMPAVTHARASGDYSSDPAQWAIATTALFYDAVGVQPFKDVFRTTEVQAPNPYQEPNWFLEALVATLSTAPVGFGDKINATNASLVMRTCRGGASDGLILKPDAPAITLDAALLSAAFPNGSLPPNAVTFVIPDIAAAHSDHAVIGTSGSARWSYLYAARVTAPFPLTLADLGRAGSAASSSLLFDYFNVFGGPVATLDGSGSSFTIPLGQGQPSAPAAAYTLRYYIAAPVLSTAGSSVSWAVAGEVDKFATMSAQRVSSVSADQSGLSVALALGVGESPLSYAVAVSAGSSGSWTMLSVTCTPAAGQMAMTLMCSSATSSCSCQ